MKLNHFQTRVRTWHHVRQLRSDIESLNWQTGCSWDWENLTCCLEPSNLGRDLSLTSGEDGQTQKYVGQTNLKATVEKHLTHMK